MGASSWPETFSVSDSRPFQTLPERFVQDKRYWTRLNQRMGHLVNAILILVLLLAFLLMGLAFGSLSLEGATPKDRYPYKVKGPQIVAHSVKKLRNGMMPLEIRRLPSKN